MIASTSLLFASTLLSTSASVPDRWRSSTSGLPFHCASRALSHRPVELARLARIASESHRTRAARRRPAASPSEIAIRPKPLHRAPQRRHRRLRAHIPTRAPPCRAAPTSFFRAIRTPSSGASGSFPVIAPSRSKPPPPHMPPHKEPASSAPAFPSLLPASEDLLQRQILRHPECIARPAAPARTPANAPRPRPARPPRSNPVSRNAGIAPRTKSTTILPVGVGLKS